MNAVLGRTARAAAARRNYSSLRSIIPPNIGFAARAGETAAAESTSTLSSEQVSKVVSLYRNLPKGEAPAAAAARGIVGRYYARYIGGKNASPAPIVHVVGILLVGGYSMHYFMHLKHHKHAENH
ncbi:ATP synthase f chain, mitochondrial precursor [Coemansia sp. RSA 552]|nr:ATP synthase f chain, mitochondrial precursor [Coemansia sp. RSA 552]